MSAVRGACHHVGRYSSALSMQEFVLPELHGEGIRG